MTLPHAALVTAACSGFGQLTASVVIVARVVLVLTRSDNFNPAFVGLSNNQLDCFHSVLGSSIDLTFLPYLRQHDAGDETSQMIDRVRGRCV
jgi:hypothetical protein